MEEILQKATELGELIKESDISKKYHELFDQLKNNDEAKNLLEEFTKISNLISEKEKVLEPVETWEKEKLQKLAQKVSDSDLLRSFIESQAEFMEFMLTIQKTINVEDN